MQLLALTLVTASTRTVAAGTVGTALALFTAAVTALLLALALVTALAATVGAVWTGATVRTFAIVSHCVCFCMCLLFVV